MLTFASRRRLMEVALVLVLAGGAFTAGVAFAVDQPHMQAALDALQKAQSELNEASHDKAGHRVKAMDLVSQAIEQVKLGITAGNS